MDILYKILSISVISLICASKMFAQSDSILCALPDTTYNNTIKDTIVLKYSRGIVPFETITREGTKYYAVTSDGHKEEITSFINGQKRVMVKDGDGHELVIDKDGNVMGVEEYKKCGGSKALLRENIKEKDSQVTRSGNVKFFSAGKYLFDTYDDYTNAAKGYAERFPSIGEGDYRPAYACAESNTKIEIKAEPYANITFKNERGVPLICKGGILEVTARGDRDTTSIYAYDAENHIVGKVNVLSYDKVTRKICLVPIGDTKAPDANTVKQGLDEIFAKLMVDFEVTIGEPITIQYAKNNKFTHGGSGMIGVYNTDQKAAINKLKERGIDNETVYLFFVKECNALKANDSPDVVNGYMPRGYQFGFIYKELSNFRTIAHEICHGAFHLKHTFDATDYLAPERSTNNLMDYTEKQPTTLNHWQWKDIHQPKSVRFKWLQEEKDAEYNVNLVFDDDEENYIGGEKILQYLLSNRREILNILDKEYSNNKIDKYLVTELIERFFYNEGYDVKIKIPEEAMNYLLHILVADLNDNSNIILDGVSIESTNEEIIRLLKKSFSWFANIVDYHEEIIGVVKSLCSLKSLDNYDVESLSIMLKNILASSDNIALKSSIIAKMSNSKFKDLLREYGDFTNKQMRQMIEYKNNNYEKLIENESFRKAISKMTNNIFEPYIDSKNKVQILYHANKINVLSSVPSYSKVIEKALQVGYLFETALAMKTIIEGNASPKDLLCFCPGASQLVDYMQNYIHPAEDNYKLITTLTDIVNAEAGKFYLQYTNQYMKMNYIVTPTSFVFRHSEDLESLFNIKPIIDKTSNKKAIYVNYSNTENYTGWRGQTIIK